MGILSYAKEMATAIIANQQVKTMVKTPEEAKLVEKIGIEQTLNLSYNVTDQIIEIYKQTDYLPWSNFDLTNEGPNPVYFCVNKWLSPEAPLHVGRTINVPFKQKGGIKKVYLKCDKGQSAKVMFYINK